MGGGEKKLCSQPPALWRTKVSVPPSVNNEVAGVKDPKVAF